MAEAHKARKMIKHFARSRKSLLVLSITLGLFLAGCIQGANQAEPTEAEYVATETNIALSSTPGPNASMMPAVSASSETRIAPPTPVPTVPPTLSAEQAREMSKLLGAPRECTIPCWNGLTPGLSRPDEITGFIARLGIDPSSKEPLVAPDGSNVIVVDFPDSHPGVSLWSVAVAWDEEVVRAIQLLYAPLRVSDFLKLSELFDVLGLPEDVELAVAGGEGPPLFTLLMRYIPYRMAIAIHGFTKLDPDPRICLEAEGPYDIAVFLYADGFEDYRPAVILYDDLKSPSFYSGIDDRLFLTLLSDRGQCIPVKP